MKFTHYFAFCAVVVLYIYTIQQRSSPEEKYRTYFDAAARCQQQISSMARHDSLAERYGVVLEELQLEAVRQTSPQKPQNQSHRRGSIPQARPVVLGTVMEAFQPLPSNGNQSSNFDLPNNIFAEVGFGDGQNATTPSSLMAELTSWGEFDSLVSSSLTSVDHCSHIFNAQVNAGMGGLDFLALGDQDRMWDNPLGNDLDHMVGS